MLIIGHHLLHHLLLLPLIRSDALGLGFGLGWSFCCVYMNTRHQKRQQIERLEGASRAIGMVSGVANVNIASWAVRSSNPRQEDGSPRAASPMLLLRLRNSATQIGICNQPIGRQVKLCPAGLMPFLPVELHRLLLDLGLVIRVLAS